ncbi:class I SAM-dependent methyltransferase [Gramella sp. Hel_I_59]|uniref:class I SAM-dependent methyltransferase n=1 Tax=Gramella sp. Hel_I_59 TaxID=1249978 RepID=UPI00163B1174|nr:class I SAM-dependent methyltransferase [Gramella sp. Hel_I_59]
MSAYLNKRGGKRKCNICGNNFKEFIKYHGGNKRIPEFRKRLDLVDSDRDNFGCPYCYSFDRERHLFLYFDKLNMWEKLSNSRILHFAPEKNLHQKIEGLKPKKYVMADYVPKSDKIEMLDATNISYADNSFDFIICNHVLEHIPDYKRAMHEIYRVLASNGVAILQTPYSKVLSSNFEDENLNTEEQRLFFYGEKDHYRIFSEFEFFEDLKNEGFSLDIVKHTSVFSKDVSFYYGVNRKEDLIRVIKNT